ncbi:hypothetical protein RBWH47_02405 [Rhodopirellula baltica WH47]|uniref:Uncharacterized protein n=1 Tax=Rhodopirellula baltica WH47 TaxID=991778 RepID=F2AYA4_RHOBT|nr:hypothetical protein RBWH47_02405 [Rhodopirellula baltica WH47]
MTLAHVLKHCWRLKSVCAIRDTIDRDTQLYPENVQLGEERRWESIELTERSIGKVPGKVQRPSAIW